MMSDTNKVTLEIVFTDKFPMSENKMTNKIKEGLKSTPFVKDVRIK